MIPAPPKATARESLAQAGSCCRRLSPIGEDFLRFVERHPEALRRATFNLLDHVESLEQDDPFLEPLQSWPTFVDRRFIGEMTDAALGLRQLVRSLPRRLFANDAQRLCEYYGFAPHLGQVLAVVLEDPTYLEGTIGRADFVYGPAGFQCIELNMSGALGGWSVECWAESYLQVPLLQTFVAEAQIELHVESPLRALFRHIADRARCAGRKKNLSIAITGVPGMEKIAVAAYLDKHLARVLAADPDFEEGEVVVCSAADLSRRGHLLFFQDRQITAVIEQSPVAAPDIFHCWMAGSVDLYNGVVSEVLRDKRNLALLSEHQASAAFSAPEQQLIARHVPWTRRLLPGQQTYRERTVDLLDFAVHERARLVVKPAAAAGGEGVTIGDHESPRSWRRVIDRAVAEGHWVVQERLRSFPFLYQHGVDGCEPHELVWGLYLFGDSYGGGYLRMRPAAEHGVVNVARGAISAVFFETRQSQETRP